jgi:hypothetical protein
LQGVVVVAVVFKTTLLVVVVGLEGIELRLELLVEIQLRSLL